MRVSTVLFVALVVVAITLVAASEAEKPKKVKLKQQGPVPLHYRRPLIDTSQSSSPDKTQALAKIAKIIAKEPIAARLKPASDAANLDLYNGEALTAESSAAKKSRIISKEIKSLNALVAQGKQILKVLPAKEKRLKALKKQLRKLNSKKVAKAAAEKLAAQKQLLADIAKQEKAMQKRLAVLRATQNKLKKSATKTAKKAKKAAPKKKKAAKKAKKAKKAAATAPKKFMFRSLRSDSEVDTDSDSEAEADSESELDAEFGEDF